MRRVAADDHQLARELQRLDGFCRIGFRVDVVVQRSSIEEERVVAQERMADGRGRLRELCRRRVARQDEQRGGLERVHCRRLCDDVGCGVAKSMMCQGWQSCGRGCGAKS